MLGAVFGAIGRTYERLVRQLDALLRLKLRIGERLSVPARIFAGALVSLAIAAIVYSIIVLTEGLSGRGEPEPLVSQPVAQPAAANDTESQPAVAPDQPAPTTDQPAPAPDQPAPTTDLIEITGEIDFGAGSARLLRSNTFTLVMSPANGMVLGSALIELDFPVGAINAAVGREAWGVDDPRDRAWESCVTVMTLIGVINGDYEPATGRVTGDVSWTIREVDANDCLKNAPPSFEPGAAPQGQVQQMSATFDGREFIGTLTTAEGEQTPIRGVAK